MSKDSEGNPNYNEMCVWAYQQLYHQNGNSNKSGFYSLALAEFSLSAF